MQNSLKLYFPKPSEKKYPFFTIPISAGKAQSIEQVVEWISLDEYVRRGAETVYYLRVKGDSMQDLHIFDGDMLVVKRMQTAENGDIVIAEVNGEYTVKKFQKKKSNLFLVPANQSYKPKQIKPKDDFAVWGVVTHVLHKF